ncbi:MAG: DUF1820 family protein [Gammaproteobacteria bacterium]|nr:DUF1820 family protein [Gammaproteobacteria bacterium]
MTKTLYKVRFLNEDKVYEIYARHVYQGDLYGFVIIEDILFDETSGVLVDPGQERLKTEFAAVKMTMVPMHSVIRIDQVEKQGTAKITSIDGKHINNGPTPIYTPRGDAGA